MLWNNLVSEIIENHDYFDITATQHYTYSYKFCLLSEQHSDTFTYLSLIQVRHSCLNDFSLR